MGQPPIDHGWAWMACLGAGVSMFFFVGGIRSLGILFISIVERFNPSNATAAAMMGLIAVVLAILCPIANAIGARYSYRLVMMVGGVALGLAGFLTGFATDIFYVIFVFGILTGIGYGCLFGTSLVVVGMYFQKRRSLANGIAMAGGSIGQLVLPLLLRYLLDNYSFTGALWIYGAFAFHVVPAAMLCRPFSFYTKNNVKAETTNTLTTLTEKNANEDNEKEFKSQTNSNNYTHKCQNSDLQNSNVSLHKSNTSIHSTKHRFKTLAEKLTSEESEGLVGDGQLNRTSYHGSVSSLAPMQDVPQEDATYPPIVSEKKEVEFTGYSTSPFHSCMTLCCSCCPVAKNPNIVPLFEWSLFRNALFLIYTAGVCCANSGYVNLCLFLPPFGKEHGLSDNKAALLISIVGVSDLFGRIIGGWFADLGLIKRSVLMSVCIIITGVSGVVVSFVPSLVSFIIFSVILGMIGGFYVSLMAVILVDFLGIQKLSSAFGLSAMCLGFFNIPIPTLLGYMKDTTETFMYTFIVCGISMVLGAIFFLLEPLARRYNARKNPEIPAEVEEGKQNGQADVVSDV